MCSKSDLIGQYVLIQLYFASQETILIGGPSHAQAGIDFEAAPGEQVVLEDEAHRMRDLLGLPEPPERYGRGHSRERFGLHALDHRRANEAGRDRADADAG